MTQEHLILAMVATFALCIGSFLNVCIYRVPKGLSVNFPSRSFCPKCDSQLTWWENIPLISWIILGAKCKACKATISGRYPFVEFLSTIAGVQCYLKFELSPTALLIYVLTASLIVITFIDFDEKIIPNVITFPGMIIGLVLGCISQFYPNLFADPITTGAMDSLLGFVFGGLFFLVIGEVYYRLTGVVGLGGGDIKLTAMICSIMGIDALIPTVFGGSVLGAIVGLALMVLQGTGRKTEIAFGPWLAIGALVFIFFDFPLFRILPN